MGDDNSWLNKFRHFAPTPSNIQNAIGSSPIGVVGSAPVGVAGTSNAGPGVYAFSQAAWPAGAVLAFESNTSGVAVIGIDDGASAFGGYFEGGQIGVQGFGTGTNGIGVQGVSGVASGHAVDAICNASCASGGGYAAYFSGNVYTTKNESALSFTTRSDLRLKKDVKNGSYGLRELLGLRPVTYHWKDPESDRDTQIGFIAQEVRKLIPEIVKEEPASGMLSVNYQGLIPVTVRAVQEQNQVIEEQRRIIERQGDRIARLERGHAASASYLVPGGLGALGLALVPLGFIVGRRKREEENA